MVKPVWTTDQIVSNLDRANVAWASEPITYAFLSGKPFHDSGGSYLGYNAFTAAQRSAAVLALSLYSDVANVTFTQGADTSDSYNKITFANSSSMPNYVWGWTQYEQYDHPVGRSDFEYAEVWVRTTNAGAGSYANGTYNYLALVHEIGHTLGLSHPGDYNADGSSITYQDDAEYQQDSRQYTIMSYFDANNTGANHGSQYASTLLLDDVAAIQAIYGANTATRAGDTVYGFHSTAGRTAYDFNATTQPIVAIWDGGGTDTIDLSGYSMACTLDLNEGAFSDVGGLTKNLTVCFGVTIENGIGGSGDDHITGNALANILDPGAGTDTVYGGDGDDVVRVWGANLTNVDMLYGGTGNDTLQFTGTNSDGLSGLRSIETIRIVDGSTFVAPAVVGGGDSGVLTIAGGALNDTIDASNVFQANSGLPSMTLVGADGDDTLTAGFTGTFILRPGTGNDTLGTAGADTVFEFAMAELTGADTIHASTSHPEFDKILFTTSGTLTGAQVAGTAGVKNFAFADGDDTFVTPNWMWAVSLYGGGGNDTFDMSAVPTGTGSRDNFEYGGDGDDLLTGSAKNDTLSGDDGNDVIHFEAGGFDAIQGGDGDDTLYGSAANTYIDIDGGAGTDVLVLTGNFSNIAVNGANIETLRLTAGFDYTISSNQGWLVDGSVLGTGDVLILDASGASAKAQNVVGGLANDTIKGNAHNDSIDGGGGDDTIFANGGNDTIAGGAGNDAIHFETAGHDVVQGGDGDDMLFGSAVSTFTDIDGGVGADILTLTGNFAGVAVTGANIETLRLTAGFDYSLTNTQSWFVDGSALGSGDVLVLDASASAQAENVVAGLANDTIRGSAEGDSLNGNGGNDTIVANGGDDIIVGGVGNDVIDAGSGNDAIYGGAGKDKITFGGDFNAADHVEGTGGIDSVILHGDYSAGVVTAASTLTGIERIVLDVGFSYDLTLNDANVANGKELTVDGSALNSGQSLGFYGGAESDGHFNLIGGAGADVLEASTHKDVVNGGGGADIITGGRGADTITGGAGVDTFVYLAASDSNASNTDNLMKFDALADSFDLWFAVADVDASLHVRRPADVAAALQSAGLDVNHAVVVTVKSGDAYVAVDANGIAGYQAGADLLIQLSTPSNVTQLTVANFI